MGRYSPTVLPEHYGPDPNFVADALGSYIQLKRQSAADARDQGRYDYEQRRHGELDPLEDALLRGRLYDMGIVPRNGSPLGGPNDGLSPGAPSFRLPQRPPIDPGMSPPSRQPGFRLPEPPSVDPGFGVPRGLAPQRDVDPGFGARGPYRELDPGFTGAPAEGGGAQQAPTPGSFDITSGTFRSPLVDMGSGYALDPSLTPDARARAARDEQERRVIAAYVGAGVDPMRSNAEVLGGDQAGLHEELFPRRSLADELALIAARGRANAGVARVRASTPRAGGSTTHPELRAVESQIDDTRAQMAAAQRERDRIGSFPLTEADSTDAEDLDAGLAALQQRMDSLNVVRDSIAANVQGKTVPGGFGDVRGGSSTAKAPAAQSTTATDSAATVSRARSRAQQLQRQGKSRADILRIMKSEGFNVR